MKPNRKQRRAAAKNRKKGKAPRPSEMSRQERAQALSIGIEQMCQRYARTDAELANMATTSAAAVRAVASGDSEEVFVARARTLFQQTLKAVEEQQQTILTDPMAGKVLGPDGNPAS